MPTSFAPGLETRTSDAAPSGVDWADVRCFLELARVHTLPRAARALQMDATAVARRISALEAGVGVSLFERTPTGHLLTQAGEDLLPGAEAMERAAADFLHRVAAADSRLSGTVRVAAPDIILDGLMFSTLERVRVDFPGITVELVESGGPPSVSDALDPPPFGE